MAAPKYLRTDQLAPGLQDQGLDCSCRRGSASRQPTFCSTEGPLSALYCHGLCCCCCCWLMHSILFRVHVSCWLHGLNRRLHIHAGCACSSLISHCTQPDAITEQIKTSQGDHHDASLAAGPFCAWRGYLIRASSGLQASCKNRVERGHTVFNGVALRLRLCRRLGLRLGLGVAHLGQLLEGALVHRLVLGIRSGRFLPVALLQRPHVPVVGLHLRFMADQCWCKGFALQRQPWLPLCSDATMCRALNLQIRQHRELLLVCICMAAAMLSHSARRCTSDMHPNRCCCIPT